MWTWPKNHPDYSISLLTRIHPHFVVTVSIATSLSTSLLLRYGVSGRTLTCKLAKVNPYDYLVWVLQLLATASTSDVGLVTPLDYLAVKEQR